MLIDILWEGTFSKDVSNPASFTSALRVVPQYITAATVSQASFGSYIEHYITIYVKNEQ